MSTANIKITNKSIDEDYEIDWSGVVGEPGELPRGNKVSKDHAGGLVCDCGADKTYGVDVATFGNLHSTWCSKYVK